MKIIGSILIKILIKCTCTCNPIYLINAFLNNHILSLIKIDQKLVFDVDLYNFAL